MRTVCSALIAVLAAAGAGQAATIPVVEDVMTSSFFTGTNLVRGYGVETNRPTLRVSTFDPFGTSGAETIYLTFDPAAFASYSGPVPQALLTLESVAGGFMADATDANPFAVSAHAVNADPIASITDDTNPTGPISWTDFFANNILPAAPAATTTITGFGPVSFDVTGIVNDWISGANTVFAIALTGKNHTLNDAEFLHGFSNNNNAGAPLGVTSISIVPEPSAAALAVVAATALLAGRRRRVGQK